MSVEAVLRQFGIAEARWQRLRRGNVNAQWRVRAPDGDYALKRLHVERLPKHTEREHLVLRHLAQAGWSVPKPVATEDGSTYLRIDDRTWWLAPWLPGRQALRNRRTALRIGTLLANLHNALAPLASLPGSNEDWGSSCATASSPAPRAIVDRTIPRHGWRFADALVELERADPARGGRLRRELDRVTEALAGVPVGPTVIGHSDLSPANVLVCGGTTSVLDFEFAGPQERVNDVAISVCHYGDPLLAGAIVEGYGELTDEERRAVPLFFDARLLTYASWVTFAWSMGRAMPAELDEVFDEVGRCGA